MVSFLLASYLILLCCPFLQVELTVQIAALCKRCAAVTSIPVLCTTGRLVPGDSASRTLQYHPSTQPQLGMGRPLAPLACRQEKSSVCGSMWAKQDPKSKGFRMTKVNPVVSHASDWLRLHLFHEMKHFDACHTWLQSEICLF